MDQIPGNVAMHSELSQKKKKIHIALQVGKYCLNSLAHYQVPKALRVIQWPE